MTRKHASRAVALYATVLASLFLFAVCALPLPHAQAAGTAPDVAYHTQDDIRNFYKSSGLNLNAPTNLAENANIEAPYNQGKVSEETLQQALKLVNFARYVAGLNSDVTLDAQYNAQCQAAVLVNALNNSLSRSPQRPDGMSDALYATAQVGCASSSLYASGSYANLQYTLLYNWLSAAASTGLDLLGPRGNILNPKMGKTGFGVIPYTQRGESYWGWCSMYAADTSGTSEVPDVVAWPAQNTPVELVPSVSTWSISTNYDLDPASIKVNVRRNTDGRTWEFSQAKLNLTIGDNGYGKQGYISFKPSCAPIKVDDSFTVSVTGTPTPIEYDVNFFGISTGITSISLEKGPFTYTGEPQTPKITAMHYDRVLTENVDYTVEYTNNTNAGQAIVTVTGLGKYASVKETSFTINKASVTGASIVLAQDKILYDGKEKKPRPTVKVNGRVLIAGVDYTLSYDKNKEIGTALLTVTGTKNYKGEARRTFEIVKTLSTSSPNKGTSNNGGSGSNGSGSSSDGQVTAAKKANKITVTAPAKTYKRSAVKAKARSFKIAAKAKGGAKLTYEVSKRLKTGKVTAKKVKKWVAVNASGKVTVKKGAPRGTYRLKVKITAKATKAYKKTTVTKTITIKVK